MAQKGFLKVILIILALPVISIVVFLVLFFLFAIVGCYTSDSSLNRLKIHYQNIPSFSQATKLSYGENKGKKCNIEGGGQESPDIISMYGTNSPDSEVAAFFTRELELKGWSYAGESKHSLNYYRKLSFRKEKLSLDLEFWFKEDFESEKTSIDITKYSTVYKLWFSGPLD